MISVILLLVALIATDAQTEVHWTACNDVDYKNLEYLDRHAPSCDAGTVMSGWKLTRDGCTQAGASHRVRYTCDSAAMTGLITERWSGCDLIFNEKLEFLDRHAASCEDSEALVGWHLSRHGCSEGMGKMQSQCEALLSTTPLTVSGSGECEDVDGDQLQNLDRHMISCPAGSALSFWLLARGPCTGTNSHRMEYTCISLATSANGDPHLALPHGGRADFRGEHKALYNFLSSARLSLNVMTELADFELHQTNHSRHKVVHGSFLTQAHVVARTLGGRVMRISFWADKIGLSNLAFANGTVDDQPAFKLGPHTDKKVDDVKVALDYSSMHVITPEFEVVVTPHAFRLERNVVGLHHRLDVQLKLRIAEGRLTVPPHGVIGQGWDGDGLAVDGEEDSWPLAGEFTTYAQAKGAIEGTPSDYRVASPFATGFKFSRFDALTAAPRNVSELVAQGVLSTPKKAGLAGSSAVGSTERTSEAAYLFNEPVQS